MKRTSLGPGREHTPYRRIRLLKRPLVTSAARTAVRPPARPPQHNGRSMELRSEDASTPTSGARAVFRGSTAYAAIAAVQRGLTFLLLPLYTRSLTPAEYGELGIALAVYGAAAL